MVQVSCGEISVDCGLFRENQTKVPVIFLEFPSPRLLAHRVVHLVANLGMVRQ